MAADSTKTDFESRGVGHLVIFGGSQGWEWAEGISQMTVIVDGMSFVPFVTLIGRINADIDWKGQSRAVSCDLNEEEEQNELDWVGSRARHDVRDCE